MAKRYIQRFLQYAEGWVTVEADSLEEAERELEKREGPEPLCPTCSGYRQNSGVSIQPDGWEPDGDVEVVI